MEENKTIKPQFLGQEHDIFYAQLKSIVKKYIAANSKGIYLVSGLKSVLLLSIYAVLYALLINTGDNLVMLFSTYALMGVVVIMIFLNIIHPAAHNSLFRSKKLNSLCQHIFELLGTSSYLWRIRHVRLHHPYANIPSWDCDIEQSDIIKFFPDARFYWYHRYQYIYGPFLYLVYTLNWIFIRDFRDLFDKTRIVKKAVVFSKWEFYKLIIVKIFYIFYMIVLPFLLLETSLVNIVTGFFLMHFIASGLGLIALVSTHTGENSIWTFPQEDGKVHQTWAYHQLISTNDFSTENPLANFTFGYFNHHVAHHLFPSLNPQLYLSVTRIIREYAKENNLPYRNYSMSESLYSHFKLLRKNAFQLNLNAEL